MVGDGAWLRHTRHDFQALVVQELTVLASSLRFRLIASLAVVLMLTSAVLYASRYRLELETYRDALERRDAELQGQTVSSLANMAHSAFKPPWKLAFLTDGAQSQGLDVYRHTLSLWEFPEVGTRSPTLERWSETEPLDWLFVLRSVLSLAAFVLGYDAVCGRRQRRRLRLILTYASSRAEVLTAKLLALWTCLAAPFLAGALLGLPVLVLYGGVRFQAAELAKVGATVLLGLGSAALFASMAILVSILSGSAEHGLVKGALVWVTAVVVIPGAAGLAAQMARPLPSDQQIARRIAEVRGQVLGVEEDNPKTWRSRALAAVDGYAWERRSAAAEMKRYERQEKIRRDLVRDQLAQVALARNVAALSPMALLQDATERLVGSGPYRDRRFLEQVWAFHEVLAAYVGELDRRDPESPHLLFFPGYLSAQPVSVDEVPRFAFAEASLGEGLRAASGRLLALAVWTAALAALAYATFARWEVR